MITSLALALRGISGCALILLLSGCGKGHDPGATPAPAPPSVASGSINGQAAPAPAPNPAPQISPPANNVKPIAVQPVVINSSADTSAVLGQLTQALRKFSFEQRRVPKSFSEVVGAGYVSGMPQAPPGKQFAVDVKRVEVVLVKQ